MNRSIKIFIAAMVGSIIFGAGLLIGDHHLSKVEKPSTVIHVVTLDWKADAKPEQAALRRTCFERIPELKPQAETSPWDFETVWQGLRA